ncbi:MAG: peptidylprolyl isomerase [Acidobacteria bacterium]|nr:peptidylprolyl isomerase [Acidobacteriota bacterium]
MRVLRSFLPAGLAVAVSFVLAACGDDSPTAPSSGVYSQTDVTVGTGAESTVGKTVKVHYTGWLWAPAKPEQKGLEFETSRTGEPLQFTVGAGQVIKGLDQGVVGMKVGGLRRLVVPPSMAYGMSRNGPIPPNATLVFDVELTSVK